MRKRIYVAGPLGGSRDNPYGEDQQAINMGIAIDAGQQLLDAGYAPLVPHLTLTWQQRHPNHWDTWLEMDESWVFASDAVLRLPGVSQGADREVEFARSLGIPVFYSVADLQSGLPATRRLIGLTGYARSGKNTVAFCLARHGFLEDSFAAPIKGIAAAIGWDGTKDHHPPCPSCDMLQGRPLLQYLGTEGGRTHLWPEVWIDALFRRLDPAAEYAITDVRYPNEADAIRRHGGVIWRINRPGCVSSGHPSEFSVDQITPDEVLNNDSDLSDLTVRVEKLLSVTDN